MAGPRARRSPCRNPPPTGKDEVAGAAPIEGSGTPTQAPAVARFPTPYSIKMAGTRARSSPRQNPSPVKRGNDEPAKQAPGASINSSGSHALTLILACAHCILLRSSLQ